MKSYSNPRFLILALLLLGFLAGFAGTDPARKHKKEVRKHRKEMDKEFRNPETSPLKEKAADFKGLEYFPIDPAYRVVARFSRSQDETTFEMPTSNPERNKVYYKYGVLDFVLNGDSLQLSVYRSPRLAAMPEYKDHLFLPFKDFTNGEDTYGGGRYLDLSITQDSVMVLDFNLCYNPYCAYGDGWSCPIPPDENSLPVPISAGVKNYQDH